jgi:hypothetical protein
MEKLKCFNRLLLTVLQGCKGHCEGLTVHLGQREAEATALRLALQYRCVHAACDTGGREGMGRPRMAPVHSRGPAVARGHGPSPGKSGSRSSSPGCWGSLQG